MPCRPRPVPAVQALQVLHPWILGHALCSGHCCLATITHAAVPGGTHRILASRPHGSRLFAGRIGAWSPPIGGREELERVLLLPSAGLWVGALSERCQARGGRSRDSMAKMWSLQMPDYSEISENVWTNSRLYNNRIMSLIKKSLLDETTCPEISERSFFFLFCLIEGEADAIRHYCCNPICPRVVVMETDWYP